MQQRLAAGHGSQCGFCTPGIVMSMYTLLRNKRRPDMEDIETYFQGNLCRFIYAGTRHCLQVHRLPANPGEPPDPHRRQLGGQLSSC